MKSAEIIQSHIKRRKETDMYSHKDDVVVVGVISVLIAVPIVALVIIAVAAIKHIFGA